jgi:hypothetical protein
MKTVTSRLEWTQRGMSFNGFNPEGKQSCVTVLISREKELFKAGKQLNKLSELCTDRVKAVWGEVYGWTVSAEWGAVRPLWYIYTTLIFRVNKVS